MEKEYKLSDDSEGLGVLSANRFTIGSDLEVNGTEAEEIPVFIPTKQELKEIVKYWIHRALDIHFYYFCYELLDWRVSNYARRRINRAGKILTEQEMDEMIAEAERDLKNKYKISDEVWNIFKNGSSEQWEAYRNK